jgi:hypothetical protein
VSPVIDPPGPAGGRGLAAAAGSERGGRDASGSPAWAAADDRAVRVLFAEARRRRRRIRLAGLVVVVALAAAAAALGLVWPRHPAGRAGGGSVPAAGSGAAQAATGPQLAWVNASDGLLLGDLTTFTTRVVAEVNADPSVPLVSFGGHLYWVNQGGGQVDGAYWPQTTEELNLATGTSTDIGPGEYMFLSADGRRLYISQTDTTLAELPSSVPGPNRQLSLPAGWYLPGGFSVAVANGIVVQSNDAQAPARPPDLAVWNPQTRQLTVIGRAIGNYVANVISAYTPPGAGYSLLAWTPATCRIPLCPITITNTATLASRTLRSPLGYGFVLGGAFSPDGRQLAVFVNDSPEAGGQTAELAIASTATGTVRLIPAVRMTVGEDIDWARWLPGGTRLVVLANRDYLVTAATLAARPFRFADGGQDVSFSAALIPGAANPGRR